MFQLKTSIGKAIIAKALYEKGINGQITLEKGELCFRGFDRVVPEIRAFTEVMKLKADEYNAKLESIKKETGETAIPAHLIEERNVLEKEIEKQRERIFELCFGDDEYRAMIDVCENAKKVWYKAIQEKNECAESEKRDKMVAPSADEFTKFTDFIKDLNDAEKVKTNE